jgi:hypothetical protein
MFKEHSTEKLIEYIQTLPDKEQKVIVKTLSSNKVKKVGKKATRGRTEQDVLDSIKRGLEEIKESKRTGKPLKSLSETLHELKNQR